MVPNILGKDYFVLQAALIMISIMMPRMVDDSTCAALKNDPQTIHILVVMLTDSGHQLNKVLVDQMGVDDYITKSFGYSPFFVVE